MSDLFGGLGGLMKGLSSLMPQDDPNTQIFKMQTEVSELKKQEADIYAEIGRQAIEKYGAESFEALAERLQMTQNNLAATQNKLQELEKAKEEKEAAERAARSQRTCTQCGYENPEGTKFCQECGAKLGVQNLCLSCGYQNAVGVKFCQECGTKLTANLICPECGKENTPGTRFCGDCGCQL